MASHIQDLLKAAHNVTLLGEDDGLSTPASPTEGLADFSTPDSDDVIRARQHAALKTYVDSVPYTCESSEEMERILATIVGKISIAVKSNHISILRDLDGAMSTWLALKYPLSKATRIKLLRFYYELCMVPSERSLVNERIYMFLALLPHKRDSIMALDANDLALDWRPLWRIVKKELWPLKRLIDPTKNVADLYLHLAENCKRFFPVTEIKPILNTFLPLLSPSTYLSIIPVLTSFLPLAHPDDYLSAVFAIWRAFNSRLADERFTELLGCLAEEHVLGAGEEGNGPHWKDVGILTLEQWKYSMGKLLATLDEWSSGNKGKNGPSARADDASSVKNGARIKKVINRQYEFAKLVVYSISVDGPIKVESRTDAGLCGGSTALDSLEKILISRESLFHPTNSGPWTLGLADLVLHLSSEFCKRWKEEEDPKCKTPLTQRLTRRIRRAFVTVLRAPLLFLLFGKDSVSTGLAQSALRKLAFLEPDVIMPQLLERAYNDLEIVNETHRTTATLGMLANVALPLVSEKVWPGGQKHLVPLLELSLPGIDLNDPTKTMCTCNFIQSVVQHIKIGDLSMHASYSGGLTSDSDPSSSMDVDEEPNAIPEGVEGFQRLNREEEWVLARESTSGFADWITSLFRRSLSLYENLPEEGGRRNTTGGKTEESVLKAIKNMLDVVCLHLSSPLFDLSLKIVHEYATTNTRANAVRAISQMISCLSRANPQKTTDRFLSHCVETIKEELKHGASSVATTSTHTALPSDTTLHWNVSVLRGCLGYGGPTLLKHRSTIINLLKDLIEKTRSERGYTGTGRLLLRLLNTLSNVYPLNIRFVNTSEWESEEFDKNHMREWGRLYEASDVKIEWHVPSDDEISFIIEIMDQVVQPLIEKLGNLLQSARSWGSSERNDFCRYLNAVRSAWQGLPTMLREVSSQAAMPTNREWDIPELLPSKLGLNAGFVLSNPEDPRYKSLEAYREAFGAVVDQATSVLGSEGGEDDHIDAVILMLKAIDTYMSEYATSKAGISLLRKSYILARDHTRMWPRQKQSTRLLFVKRAQVYHNARLSTHSTYRQRSAIGVKLTDHLVELSLSPYTRVRRIAQSILEGVIQSYPLTSRSVVLKMLSNLKRGTDPDRMKGALFTLQSNNIRSTLRYDPELLASLMIALLECQHQEKPSVQKLIFTILKDFLQCFSEDILRKPSSIDFPESLESSLTNLCSNFNIVCDERLLSAAKEKSRKQHVQVNASYDSMLSSIVGTARRPSTHWRYLHMALQYLVVMMRRDVPPSAEVASLLMETTITSHVTTRTLALKGLTKLLALVKIRSYSKNDEELWFEEWRSPFQTDLNISDGQRMKAFIQAPFIEGQDLSGTPFVDKITSGFLAWQPTVKAYKPPQKDSQVDDIWDEDSRPALKIIKDKVKDMTHFKTCIGLWAQESDTRGAVGTDLTLRLENIFFIKTLAKHYEFECIKVLLNLIEPMIRDPNRFKQRASAEVLSGLLRGSKHWSIAHLDTLWDFLMTRIEIIFSQIRPDTVAFWDSLFRHIIAERDPRRNKRLIDKILSRPIDFHSDSAFLVTKSLDQFLAVAEESQIRFGGVANQYITLLFKNADTDFAEIRNIIAQSISILMNCEWCPSYDSVDAFLNACSNDPDPFKIRQGLHVELVAAIAQKLPQWRKERLPPPRTNQSQFDKVSLTVLIWMWNIGHTVDAGLIFPYIVPILPEILKMSDLHDNMDLASHSSSVLFLLSSISVPEQYIEEIADKLADTIRSSKSWKMKSTGLVLMTVYLFRYMLSLSEQCMERSMSVVVGCLDDENLEVTETAAKLLGTMLRTTQRHKILPLRDRFVAEVRRARLPNRQDPEYSAKLRALHAGILGIRALIESFPFTVEPWMPPLTEVLSPHASDPPPISSTIRKCASEFKRTHQDTWHLDERAFTPDQLQDLSTMLIGTSYYA